MVVIFAELANHDALGSLGVNIRGRGRKVVDNNTSLLAEDEYVLRVEFYICLPYAIDAGTELKIWYGASANGQLLMHGTFELTIDAS